MRIAGSWTVDTGHDENLAAHSSGRPFAVQQSTQPGYKAIESEAMPSGVISPRITLMLHPGYAGYSRQPATPRPAGPKMTALPNPILFLVTPLCGVTRIPTPHIQSDKLPPTGGGYPTAPHPIGVRLAHPNLPMPPPPRRLPVRNEPQHSPRSRTANHGRGQAAPPSHSSFPRRRESTRPGARLKFYRTSDSIAST